MEVIFVSFLDKIDEYCQQYDKKQTPFEREAGLPKGIINKWRNGTKPRIDSLQKVADYMNVTLKDLMSTDAADIYGSSLIPDNWTDGPDVVRDSSLRYIPVYRCLSPDGSSPEPDDIMTHFAILPDNTPDANECFGFAVTDSGMSPYIDPGDIVIVRSDPEPESEDIVVVSVPGTGTVCRKLIRNGDDIILQPFSMHYSATLYRSHELDLLPVIMRGKVITVVRNVRSSSESIPEI